MDWIIIASLSIITNVIAGLILIIRKLIKKHNQPKHRNINIFGSQTIKHHQQTEDEQETETKKLKKEIYRISEMVKTLSKAIRIYVQNNGANETTKKIIGELLDEKNI